MYSYSISIVDVYRYLYISSVSRCVSKGVRAMLMKPVYAHECRNSRLEAKGQLLRLSTGSKKPALHVYGFSDCEVIQHALEAGLLIIMIVIVIHIMFVKIFIK